MFRKNKYLKWAYQLIIQYKSNQSLNKKIFKKHHQIKINFSKSSKTSLAKKNKIK